MAEKEMCHLFYFPSLPCGAANILKQDALSVGAELAVERGVPDCSTPTTRAVLIATTKQLKKLIQKEQLQPFGLKKVAQKLKSFLNLPTFPVQIMGVINANHDSFYRFSRFEGERAVEAIERLIEEGADIIDIGGVSSRPGSRYPGEEEELRRVKPILDQIYRRNLYEKVEFSLDTFSPRVLHYGLERGIKIANDITGGESREYLRLVARYGAKLVLMHKKGDPATMQLNPFYENVMVEVDRFFEERIAKAREEGVEEIIVDVGIGFGKRLEDNMALLHHLEHFRRFGYPLLVGASRKSLIGMAMEREGISPASVEERLPGTIALHWEALQNGASILRCHDVAAHRQMVAVWKSLHKTSLNFI